VTDAPNPLVSPNDFVGPLNVRNELYGTAVAAVDIAAAKADYDELYTGAPPAMLSTYVFKPARPPVPPAGRAMPRPVIGPISAGRRVVYDRPHVVDDDIRKRIRRGYYK